jgi:glycosyltransferase involved in cell wall biosynthesis
MISVIIPTYTSTQALDLCLGSAIKGQKNKNQIIVVVDGHYDLNKEILDKYKEQIDVLDLEINRGACKAINLGVYNATSNKILIVNDDNVFPKNWDVKLEEKFQPNWVWAPNQIEPNPSMFPQFNIKNLGTSVDSFSLNRFWEYESTVSKDKVEFNGSTFPIFMDKIDYLRIGGFDESFPSQAGFATDWEFFFKM